MSAKPTRVTKKTEITEADVRAYLALNPAFFETNSDILVGISVPHRSGGLVSLVEKQIEVLREENNRLKQQIDNMITNAKQNELMYKRINALVMRLTLADDVQDVCRLIEEQIVDLFVVEIVNVTLFSKSQPAPESGGANVESEEQARLGTLLAAGQRSASAPELDEATTQALFGPIADNVASCALIGLGENGEHGLIAIGSFFEQRFSREMSTDYLDYLSEVLTVFVAQPDR